MKLRVFWWVDLDLFMLWSYLITIYAGFRLQHFIIVLECDELTTESFSEYINIMLALIFFIAFSRSTVNGLT